MAYDEDLQERLERSLKAKKVHFSLKKMFGGLAFMVDDKMCLGILGERLMIRVDPKKKDFYLSKTGVTEMDFTGRPMKGFMYVNPEGYDMEADLNYWIEECLAWNPFANSSKREKA